MSTHNHTAIGNGAAANAGTINTPLGTLDAAIGDLTALTTTAKTSAVAAINEVNANAASSTAIGNLATLTTIVKTSAVAAINEVATKPGPNIVFDPINYDLAWGDEWGDKTHWYGYPSNNSFIVDAANPFGGPTWRIGTGASVSGKKIWFSETGLKFGDTVTFKALFTAASGTYTLAVKQMNAADTLIGAQADSGALTPAGSITLATTTLTLDEATAAGVYVYMVRLSGAVSIDLYALWGGAGHVSDYPAAGWPAPYSTRQAISLANISVRLAPNVVWDAFNTDLAPGDEWGNHASHWQSDANFSIVTPDAANPYGGRTLRMANTIGGKKIYFDESGLKFGDTVTFRALVNAPSGEYYMAARACTADGTLIGPQASGDQLTFAGAAQTLEISITADTATAAGIAVYVVRLSGAADADIYAMWGGLGDVGTQPAAGPAPYATSSAVTIPAFPTAQAEYGRHYLRNWQFALAEVENGVPNIQAVCALLGDSWIQNDRIGDPLRRWLQTAYGNGGPGYVGIGADHGAPTVTGLTYTRTGTWTDSDAAAGSRGVDIAHADTSDVATPAKVVITGTFTDAAIHYIKLVTGGKFRWQVDSDGWNTVDTVAGAEARATVAITGKTNASHTLTIECTDAATAGIRLCGVDLRIAGNGVVVHRLGNGGTTSTDWTDVDATFWKAGLAALSPDLCVILLGTNDQSADFAPASFGTNIGTLIDRIQAQFGTACDILLLSPAENGLAGRVYTVAQYATELRTQAVTQNCAMEDAYMHIKPYATDSTDGWENSSHLNSQGALIVSNLLVRMLRAD